MTTYRGFLIDTCGFNRSVDGKLDLGELQASGTLHVTKHQARELMQADEPRRSALIKEFVRYETVELETATARALTAAADCDIWEFPREIAVELDQLQPKRGAQNWTDALLIDCARHHQVTYVTSDQGAADVAQHYGVPLLRIR